MAKAPLPDIFPGEFFVLRWDRDRETFVVELDDEAHSSYDLGPEPLVVAELFRRRGLTKQLREQTVDLAREFGMAQCIPAQERVLQILPREAQKPPTLSFEEPEHAWIPSLY